MVAISITLKVMDEFLMKDPLKLRAFVINLIILVVLTVYVNVNMFLMVNYRGNDYYMDEGLVGYYSFYVDWCYVFWKDIFMNLDIVVK